MLSFTQLIHHLSSSFERSILKLIFRAFKIKDQMVWNSDDDLTFVYWSKINQFNLSTEQSKNKAKTNQSSLFVFLKKKKIEDDREHWKIRINHKKP